jgi:hypothetical protein
MKQKSMSHDMINITDEDYVEEQWDSSTITAKQFLLQVQIQNPNLRMFYKLLF